MRIQYELKPVNELVIRREEVKILAVSDTHLGFDEANPLFFEFLDVVTDFDVDFFMILGDFLDLWRRDLAGCIIQFSDVLQKLREINKQIKVILIAGNHDWHLIPSKYDMGNVYKYQDPFYWWEVVKIILPEREYKFLHGHQFDLKCSNRKVNETLCHSNDNAGKEMSNAWYRMHLTGAAMKNSEFILKFGPCYPVIPPQYLELYQYVANPGAAECKWKAIKALAENSSNYEYIVYGHTHHAYVSDKSANTGCWCKENSDYIIINDYKVKLFKYK